MVSLHSFLVPFFFKKKKFLLFYASAFFRLAKGSTRKITIT